MTEPSENSIFCTASANPFPLGQLGFFIEGRSGVQTSMSCKGIVPKRGSSPICAKTCPSQFKGSFSAFFRGCLPSLPATRTLTLWIVSNGPDLLPANGSSLSGIALLSGPIWDRASRVTQACHLKRIASKHDRRIGCIGDWTDHLCRRRGIIILTDCRVRALVRRHEWH